jgi:hypothetical protein
MWMMGWSFVALYVFNFVFQWPVTRSSGFSNGDFLFGDFSWLSTWSTACRISVNFQNLFSLKSQIESIESCSGFNYGISLLLILSIFEISWSSYVILALIVGVIGVFAWGLFVGASYSMRWWERGLVLISVFSPGVFLLFERGNLDFIMFLLVLASIVFLARNLFVAAFLTLLLATLLKFYTFPLLVFMLFLSRSFGRRLFAATLTTVCFLVVATDLATAPALPAQGPVQFGFPVLNHYLEWFGIFLAPWPSIIGLVIPLGVWVGLALRSKRSQKSSDTQTIESLANDYTFLFSGVTFVAVFFVGLSYDYRLIFLAVAGISLILIGHWSTVEKTVLWSSLVLALWGSGAVGYTFDFIPEGARLLLIGGFQLLGDLATFAWVGLLLHFGSRSVAVRFIWLSKILNFAFGIPKSKV